jgi:hemoglobin
VQTPYELLGGEDGVRRLADAFYEVMDERPDSATIRRMHAADLATIKEKLFEFLSGWLGGPPLFPQKYGSVCLISAHRPYAIGAAERDQWLACMDAALERVQATPQVREMLKRPLFGIADAIRNTETQACESPSEEACRG